MNKELIRSGILSMVQTVRRGRRDPLTTYYKNVVVNILFF